MRQTGLMSTRSCAHAGLTVWLNTAPPCHARDLMPCASLSVSSDELRRDVAAGPREPESAAESFRSERRVPAARALDPHRGLPPPSLWGFRISQRAFFQSPVLRASLRKALLFSRGSQITAVP
ncbi:hypothetical protein AAFF_G00056910 [Aldrovandia affinis]|uniref:Uncharacterized protein n=1 Tax=Aldrovandia affinis TaxID=143900 RepID=A0AAD7WE51_9TELE|nr:hypothetical protein AAFF_G00056910 [Aldrovandia affinis]